MKIAMDKLCIVFANAFDIIEEEQLGASEYHSMRVAALCAGLGRRLGFDDDAVTGMSVCGMFHDNALTEYHLSMVEGEQRHRNMILHCEKGQSNVSWLPFRKSIDGFILYHHECGTGEGPFGKREGETPFEAEIIAAADAIDATHKLQQIPSEKLQDLKDRIWIRAKAYSTTSAVSNLLQMLDADFLESLRDENIAQTLDVILPHWEMDVADPGVIRASGFISRVIDYKSHFTQKHTSQIANRAWIMAESYKYSYEDKAALFLAASLHDIGKIGTPVGILEKPGQLDDDEFEIIKMHVQYSRDYLTNMPNFALITNWAADHHEKLDGSGYPLGKSASELDFNSRLIACLDIYQAVSEPRPYHGARTHKETMEILNSMASRGFIDAGIVGDVDEVMAKYSTKDVPSPISSGTADKSERR